MRKESFFMQQSRYVYPSNHNLIVMKAEVTELVRSTVTGSIAVVCLLDVTPYMTLKYFLAIFTLEIKSSPTVFNYL